MIISPNNPIDTLDLLRRWLAKIELRPGPLSTPCWIWTAGSNSKDYPAIRAGKQVVYAHRLAYELFVGEVPYGKEIHHRCQTHRCVNPAHLQPLTKEHNRFLQAMGIGEPEEVLPI